MLQFRTLAATLLIVGLLTGCGDPTKEEILKKSEGADTKTLLEKALGRPDDIKKLGPLESWTYRAADGSVTFVIAGDQVTISTTDDKKPADSAK
ncbi:MAG: hypothetical protein EPO08_18905 [Rhodospirillaceae bacterium]|nr:MAG: hypothetical protein EPO08_18905 [Rhodospirillaceae bacterium]